MNMTWRFLKSPRRNSPSKHWIWCCLGDILERNTCSYATVVRACLQVFNLKQRSDHLKFRGMIMCSATRHQGSGVPGCKRARVLCWSLWILGTWKSGNPKIWNTKNILNPRYVLPNTSARSREERSLPFSSNFKHFAVNICREHSGGEEKQYKKTGRTPPS